MGLEISSAFGRIALQHSPAQLQIQNGQTSVSIHQVPAEVAIEADPVRVEIDLTKAYADMGLRTSSAFLRQNADAGWQESLKGIARQAQLGDRMAEAAGRGQNLLAQLGKEALASAHEVNVGVVPKHRPEISFSGGLKVEATQPEIDVSAKTTPPRIRYTPGTVDVNVSPKPAIEIEFVGGILDIIA